MIRQQLEDYLDNTLTSEDRAQLERQLETDSTLAQTLAGVKATRALRAAALASYEPSAGESQKLAASILIACHEESLAPLGRIAPWIKRTLSVAAALAILAGTFSLGRFTAPQNTSVAGTSAQPERVYCVLYNDEAGEPQLKEFASMDDANVFMKDMSDRHAEPVAIASSFDADHPGSF